MPYKPGEQPQARIPERDMADKHDHRRPPVQPAGMSVSFRLAGRRVLIALAVAVAVMSSMLVIAGCGSLNRPSNHTSIASKLAAAGVRFASCMRSNAVSNFPDPTTSGIGVGFSLSSRSGINPASPAYRSAQKACSKLLPGSGPGSVKPSAATKTQMLAISACMRAHGVSGFPDPTTTPPSSPAAYGGLLERNGVSFAIPTTIDLQSPAVQQAATACQLGGLGQGG
jgi:hypothetical protein